MRYKTPEKIRGELTKLFQKAKYESSPDLCLFLWQSINSREKQAARLKSWAFAFLGLASLAGLVPAFRALSSDLAQSGFYEYFSILFSDSGSVLSYWKELAFSLAESLPAISIIFTLSLFLICLLSIKHLIKQFGKGQLIFRSSPRLSIPA
jgi:hypothetical protein